MRSRVTAVLAAVALLASACTGTDVPADASGGAGAGRGVAGAALGWNECEDGFECAKLAVPLDHRKPDGEKIELSVIRLPASGSGSARSSSIPVVRVPPECNTREVPAPR